MAAINSGRSQIALVVNHDRQLIGTVTDGDVRRGLLDGLNLTDPVTKIMRRDFCSVTDATADHEILDIMKDGSFHQIPIVDYFGRPIELVVLDDLLRSSFRPNQVLLMAGGQGVRLRPLTSNRPKPMLPIGEKPMLQIILEKCISHGLHNFIMSVGYLKEQIMTYFSDGSEWGAEIQYIEEANPLGTAGAIGSISDQITAPLLVMNGDVISDVNLNHLLDFHERKQAQITLAVRLYEIAVPYGVVSLESHTVRGFEEKPRIHKHVNAGIYVLSPNVVQQVPANKYLDMSDLVEAHIASGNVFAFPVHEHWSDVGSLEALKQAEVDWS